MDETIARTQNSTKREHSGVFGPLLRRVCAAGAMAGAMAVAQPAYSELMAPPQ